MIKLISGVLLLGLILTSPVIMDHARDIYLQEIVTPKAMPVKVNDTQVVASSFQLQYKDKRVTVTNNHVCSIVATIAKRKAKAKINAHYEKILTILPGLADAYRDAANTVIDNYNFPIVGEKLKIGNINRVILYNSPNHDICFLEPVGTRSFELASSYHRGERVSIVGNPRGLKQSITDGRLVGEAVESFRWLPDAGKVKVLKTTAITYPGNSGSPVINRYGNVIGILFAGTSLDYSNVNYVVPMEAIASELEVYFK